MTYLKRSLQPSLKEEEKLVVVVGGCGGDGGGGGGGDGGGGGGHGSGGGGTPIAFSINTLIDIPIAILIRIGEVDADTLHPYNHPL